MAVASAFEVDVREFTQRISETESTDAAKANTDDAADGNVSIGKHRWSPTRIAVISSIVMFPALYVTLAYGFAYILDFWLLAAPLQAFYSNPEIVELFKDVLPIVLVGGLAAAVILNLVAMTSIRFIRSKNGWMSMVRFVPRKANLSMLGLSAIVTVTLITYRLLENSTYY